MTNIRYEDNQEVILTDNDYEEPQERLSIMEINNLWFKMLTSLTSNERSELFSNFQKIDTPKDFFNSSLEKKISDSEIINQNILAFKEFIIEKKRKNNRFYVANQALFSILFQIEGDDLIFRENAYDFIAYLIQSPRK